jgi:hypothetical protein
MICPRSETSGMQRPPLGVSYGGPNLFRGRRSPRVELALIPCVRQLHDEFLPELPPDSRGISRQDSVFEIYSRR